MGHGGDRAGAPARTVGWTRYANEPHRALFARIVGGAAVKMSGGLWSRTLKRCSRELLMLFPTIATHEHRALLACVVGGPDVVCDVSVGHQNCLCASQRGPGWLSGCPLDVCILERCTSYIQPRNSACAHLPRFAESHFPNDTSARTARRIAFIAGDNSAVVSASVVCPAAGHSVN
jgi:hypothetical protein